MKKKKQKWYNIFQGDDALINAVAETLGYEMPVESWFTSDIYFESFFYLTRRFGPPVIQDEHKDGGTWRFEVKQYRITLSLNSSWLSVIVYGKGSRVKRMSRRNFYDYSARTPYNVKRWRVMKRKRNQLVNMFTDKHTKRNLKLIDRLFDTFSKEHGIDESWTDERFKSEKAGDWTKYVDAYNNRIIGLDYREVTVKYGREYSNAQTRHALRTVRSFLKNMLVPISVRDCYFNIKGRCDGHISYEDNIPIRFIN